MQVLKYLCRVWYMWAREYSPCSYKSPESGTSTGYAVTRGRSREVVRNARQPARLGRMQVSECREGGWESHEGRVEHCFRCSCLVMLCGKSDMRQVSCSCTSCWGRSTFLVMGSPKPTGEDLWIKIVKVETQDFLKPGDHLQSP